MTALNAIDPNVCSMAHFINFSEVFLKIVQTILTDDLICALWLFKLRKIKGIKYYRATVMLKFELIWWKIKGVPFQNLRVKSR